MEGILQVDAYFRHKIFELFNILKQQKRYEKVLFYFKEYVSCDDQTNLTYYCNHFFYTTFIEFINERRNSWTRRQEEETNGIIEASDRLELQKMIVSEISNFT